MSPGPTFDRVYLALKDRLTGGRYAPGDHLEPAVLGDELNASITPVRDALHRLVGERIVHAPRNDGFRMPAPTEYELREMYGWNRELLEIALRPRFHGHRVARPVPAAEGLRGEAGTAASAADLFIRLAQASANGELAVAVERLGERLAPYRLAETALIDDLEPELELLREAWFLGDAAALRRCISVYHRRRQRLVPEILAAVRSSRRFL